MLLYQKHRTTPCIGEQETLMGRHGGNIQKLECSRGGFSLVELMIVVAIMAILAAVAVPAYINHVNRARQSDGFTALMTAKMEQEIYWEDNNRYVYAGTIGCLPSFSTNAACLANCGACPQTTFSTGQQGYTISVTFASASTYTVSAQRTIPSSGAVDILTVSSADTRRAPTVVTPNAIGFSWFDWLFP